MIIPHSAVTIIQSGNPHPGPTANRDMIAILLPRRSWQAWRYQLIFDTTKLVSGSKPREQINSVCVHVVSLCCKASRWVSESFTLLFRTDFTTSFQVNFELKMIIKMSRPEKKETIISEILTVIKVNNPWINSDNEQNFETCVVKWPVFSLSTCYNTCTLIKQSKICTYWFPDCIGLRMLYPVGWECDPQEPEGAYKEL